MSRLSASVINDTYSLRALLLRLYSREELERLLIDTFGHYFVREVPRNGSDVEFCHETVCALERKGLIDKVFFDAIEASRPALAPEIKMVRDSWISTTLSRAAGITITRRLAVLSVVESIWVRGVLNGLLFGNRFVELDLTYRLGPAGAGEQITVAGMMDILDQNIPICLTGRPGSGKSIALLQLAKITLQRARIDHIQPVPIVLHLSTWTEGTFLDWSTGEVESLYGLSPLMFHAMVKTRSIILLLDGFDEIDSRRSGNAKESIKGFHQANGLCYVVCCREGAESDLVVGGYVHLNELSLHQATAIVTESEAASLAEGAQVLSEVLSVCKTPLLARIIQRLGGMSGALRAERDLSIERVFDLFISSAIESVPQRHGLPCSQYESSLVYLAIQMKENSLFFFSLGCLQPSWLRPWQRKMFPFASLMVATGIFIAILISSAILLPLFLERDQLASQLAWLTLAGAASSPVVLLGLANGGVWNIRSPDLISWSMGIARLRVVRYVAVGVGLSLFVRASSFVDASERLLAVTHGIIVFCAICILASRRAFRLAMRLRIAGVWILAVLIFLRAYFGSLENSAVNEDKFGALLAEPFQDAVRSVAMGILVFALGFPILGISAEHIPVSDSRFKGPKGARARYLLVLLVCMFYAMIVFTRLEGGVGMAANVFVWLGVGFIFSLPLGGFSFCQLFVVRLFLAVTGDLPVGASQLVLERAVRAGLLVRVGERYSFVHSTVQQCLIERTALTSRKNVDKSCA